MLFCSTNSASALSERDICACRRGKPALRIYTGVHVVKHVPRKLSVQKRSALCALFWELGATLTAAQRGESKQEDQIGQLDAEVNGNPQVQIFCRTWFLKEHKTSPLSLCIWNYAGFPEPGFSNSPIISVLHTLLRASCFLLG